MAVTAANSKIRLFHDFYATDPIAHTAVPRPLGPFVVAGQGAAEIDAGVPAVAGVPSGAGRITTTNETEHTTLVGTAAGFVPGTMGTIVLETRVQFADLDTKEAFIGFSDIAPDTLSIETDVLSAATATLTPVASDYVGFYLSAELTADESWHAVYNGGTTNGVTDSTAADLVVDAVAGEWQILRLEITSDGTARFYIDEVLKGTVTNAVSTTVAQGLCVGVEAKGAAIETMDVDYVSLKANREQAV